MSYFMPAYGISYFLKMLFDEGEEVNWVQDPDIIDVEPLSYSTERSSDASCYKRDGTSSEQKRPEDILRLRDG